MLLRTYMSDSVVRWTQGAVSLRCILRLQTASMRLLVTIRLHCGRDARRSGVTLVARSHSLTDVRGRLRL